MPFGLAARARRIAARQPHCLDHHHHHCRAIYFGHQWVVLGTFGRGHHGRPDRFHLPDTGGRPRNLRHFV